MKIYRTQDKQLTRVDDMNEGAWICLTNPTDDEVRRVAATLDIEPADIVAATDPEESARISLEDGYTVISWTSPSRWTVPVRASIRLSPWASC